MKLLKEAKMFPNGCLPPAHIFLLPKCLRANVLIDNRSSHSRWQTFTFRQLWKCPLHLGGKTVGAGRLYLRSLFTPWWKKQTSGNVRLNFPWQRWLQRLNTSIFYVGDMYLLQLHTPIGYALSNACTGILMNNTEPCGLFTRHCCVTLVNSEFCKLASGHQRPPKAVSMAQSSSSLVHGWAGG